MGSSRAAGPSTPAERPRSWTSNSKFMNLYPFDDIETISPRPMLFITGDAAHSREPALWTSTTASASSLRQAEQLSRTPQETDHEHARRSPRRTFLMDTTEFVVAGLLPEMAAGPGVRVARAELSITVFAVGMINAFRRSPTADSNGPPKGNHPMALTTSSACLRCEGRPSRPVQGGGSTPRRARRSDRRRTAPLDERTVPGKRGLPRHGRGRGAGSADPRRDDVVTTLGSAHHAHCRPRSS